MSVDIQELIIRGRFTVQENVLLNQCQGFLNDLENPDKQRARIPIIMENYDRMTKDDKELAAIFPRYFGYSNKEFHSPSHNITTDTMGAFCGAICDILIKRLNRGLPRNGQ